MKKLLLLPLILIAFKAQAVTHSKPFTFEDQKRAERIIKEVAFDMIFPADILIAIAKVESSLDCGAVGDDGNSFGLFQIQRKTMEQQKVFGSIKQLFGDCRLNVMIAILHLKECYDYFKDTYQMIACHNFGKTGLIRWLRTNNDVKELTYVKKVLKEME